MKWWIFWLIVPFINGQEAISEFFSFTENQSTEINTIWQSEKDLDDHIAQHPYSSSSIAALEIREYFLDLSHSIDKYNKFIERYYDNIASLDKIDKVFALYKEQNRVSGYLDFIRRYPNTAHCFFAKQHIYNAVFSFVRSLNSVDDCEKFIELFPDAPQINEAIKLLYHLSIQEEQKLVKAQVANATSFDDSDAWQQRRSLNLLRLWQQKITTSLQKDSLIEICRAQRLAIVIDKVYAFSPAQTELLKDDNYKKANERLEKSGGKKYQKLVTALHQEMLRDVVAVAHCLTRHKFYLAQEKNTVESYQKFVGIFPQSLHTLWARRKARQAAVLEEREQRGEQKKMLPEGFSTEKLYTTESYAKICGCKKSFSECFMKKWHQEIVNLQFAEKKRINELYQETKTRDTKSKEKLRKKLQELKNKYLQLQEKARKEHAKSREKLRKKLQELKNKYIQLQEKARKEHAKSKERIEECAQFKKELDQKLKNEFDISFTKLSDKEVHSFTKLESLYKKRSNVALLQQQRKVGFVARSNDPDSNKYEDILNDYANSLDARLEEMLVDTEQRFFYLLAKWRMTVRKIARSISASSDDILQAEIYWEKLNVYSSLYCDQSEFSKIVHLENLRNIMTEIANKKEKEIRQSNQNLVALFAQKIEVIAGNNPDLKDALVQAQTHIHQLELLLVSAFEAIEKANSYTTTQKELQIPYNELVKFSQARQKIIDYFNDNLWEPPLIDNNLQIQISNTWKNFPIFHISKMQNSFSTVDIDKKLQKLKGADTSFSFCLPNEIKWDKTPCPSALGVLQKIYSLELGSKAKFYLQKRDFDAYFQAQYEDIYKNAYYLQMLVLPKEQPSFVFRQSNYLHLQQIPWQRKSNVCENMQNFVKKIDKLAINRRSWLVSALIQTKNFQEAISRDLNHISDSIADKIDETKIDETMIDKTKRDETKRDETKRDETKIDETKIGKIGKVLDYLKRISQIDREHAFLTAALSLSYRHAQLPLQAALKMAWLLY
ncbi:hypothetical protein [Candidatus Uabimicrobium sp. HlEnr_7]|uniref:hypothetical protein n=1 Tax=Candidatus Uabimicrobium helgolandensis TaxID=3095367 RepID=UPI0035571AC8